MISTENFENSGIDIWNMDTTGVIAGCVLVTLALLTIKGKNKSNN